MTDIEARSRLDSISSVLEHESHALESLEDPRLVDVLAQMASLRARIAATVTELDDGLVSEGRPPSTTTREQKPAAVEHRRRPRPVAKRRRVPRWALLLVVLFFLMLIWLSLQTLGSHSPSGAGQVSLSTRAAGDATRDSRLGAM